MVVIPPIIFTILKKICINSYKLQSPPERSHNSYIIEFVHQYQNPCTHRSSGVGSVFSKWWFSRLTKLHFLVVNYRLDRRVPLANIRKPPLALGAGLVSGGFFFSTLPGNHILCQIKFQVSVN